MKDILDGWDCENKDIYKFFEKEGIDVSGCSDFDFETRKKKTMDKDKEKVLKKSQERVEFKWIITMQRPQQKKVKATFPLS